jgi:hypothetical protein
MVSKLAAALLAPLLVAIVWPGSRPTTRTPQAVVPAAVGAVVTPSDPTPPTSGDARRQTASPGFRFAMTSKITSPITSAPPRLAVSPRSETAAPAAPAVSASPAFTPHTPTTKLSPKVAVYNNLNQPGMAAPSPFGSGTPPDSTGAIGPNHYVEMVNSAITVYSRSLAIVTPRTELPSFAENPSFPYCDPQIQWDPTAGRWLYAFIMCDPTSDTQEFDFGWSKTSDPHDLVNGWCKYFLDLSSTPDFPAAEIFDYPKLGHNSKYMIVGTNVFGVNGTTNPDPFGSGLLWIGKPTTA